MKYNRNEAGFTPVAMALVPMCTGGERLVRWLRSVWVCVCECPVKLENDIVNNHRSLKPLKNTLLFDDVMYFIQRHYLCVSVFLFNQQMWSSLLDYFLLSADNWPEPEKGTVVSISQLVGVPSRAGIALSLGASGVAGSSLIQAISHHPICCSISLDSATTAFIWLFSVTLYPAPFFAFDRQLVFWFSLFFKKKKKYLILFEMNTNHFSVRLKCSTRKKTKFVYFPPVLWHDTLSC